MERERASAFAPGRVNLIGEHTDYNRGLALPFAIAEGITVTAQANGSRLVRAQAADMGEGDELALDHPSPARGWRAFVHGAVAELGRAGFPLVGADVDIAGDLPQGSGLSSSAALEVALCLALIALGEGEPSASEPAIDRTELARLCARVENDWVGAHTGLLDQLASLYGAPDTALCIDFRSLRIEPVSLVLGDWRLVVVDPGERHEHASSGYNQRRAECAEACRLLGVSSLRESERDRVEGLPEPLRRRARHVISENARVIAAVSALRAGELEALGVLLDASHASLRDDYEVSTPGVERAVEALHAQGAAGARIVGGGFGGIVLGLFAPTSMPPADAREVRPSAGAHLLHAPD